ncbi:uncharacterized protein MONOS_2332 [Monocercomonoides exilis]|uniref:uncharacterized protein n=1 Tax=Monocercomonoides exilis TaxID=2049356 RepID=UPI00355A4F9B|nr:hypothetical protein MONOS_2332 [Monocercomonoides exilis]|eukprot:MONOS_2332.1-p1 / transcript=MONOS_2332.1 / gene=MONOS_2332 / organism=Monocercomonoides_exilis_PA203 / gene_product=unspecified product / transcript_product=unspecified product / location=Mono_scaffold00047:148026-151518(+) / protein_length=978 / sequence_SO=supercontig / SO=protein_coding / is_pseudo=false
MASKDAPLLTYDSKYLKQVEDAIRDPSISGSIEIIRQFRNRLLEDNRNIDSIVSSNLIPTIVLNVNLINPHPYKLELQMILFTLHRLILGSTEQQPLKSVCDELLVVHDTKNDSGTIGDKPKNLKSIENKILALKNSSVEVVCSILSDIQEEVALKIRTQRKYVNGGLIQTLFYLINTSNTKLRSESFKTLANIVSSCKAVNVIMKRENWELFDSALQVNSTLLCTGIDDGSLVEAFSVLYNMSCSASNKQVERMISLNVLKLLADAISNCIDCHSLIPKSYYPALSALLTFALGTTENIAAVGLNIEKQAQFNKFKELFEISQLSISLDKVISSSESAIIEVPFAVDKSAIKIPSDNHCKSASISLMLINKGISAMKIGEEMITKTIKQLLPCNDERILSRILDGIVALLEHSPNVQCLRDCKAEEKLIRAMSKASPFVCSKILECLTQIAYSDVPYKMDFSSPPKVCADMLEEGLFRALENVFVAVSSDSVNSSTTEKCKENPYIVANAVSALKLLKIVYENLCFDMPVEMQILHSPLLEHIFAFLIHPSSSLRSASIEIVRLISLLDRDSMSTAARSNVPRYVGEAMLLGMCLAGIVDTEMKASSQHCFLVDGSTPIIPQLFPQKLWENVKESFSAIIKQNSVVLSSSSSDSSTRKPLQDITNKVNELNTLANSGRKLIGTALDLLYGAAMAGMAMACKLARDIESQQVNPESSGSVNPKDKCIRSYVTDELEVIRIYSDSELPKQPKPQPNVFFNYFHSVGCLSVLQLFVESQLHIYKGKRQANEKGQAFNVSSVFAYEKGESGDSKLDFELFCNAILLMCFFYKAKPVPDVLLIEISKALCDLISDKSNGEQLVNYLGALSCLAEYQGNRKVLIMSGAVPVLLSCLADSSEQSIILALKLLSLFVLTIPSVHAESGDRQDVSSDASAFIEQFKISKNDLQILINLCSSKQVPSISLEAFSLLSTLHRFSVLN